MSDHAAYVDEVLEALRAAQTAEDVEKVAEAHRDRVKALYALPEWRTRALHIINLKEYRLKELGQ